MDSFLFPYISIVIPTLNREVVLINTVKYFLDNEKYPNFEIIVVDQTKFHSQKFEDFFISVKNNVRYFRLNYESLPAARNYGIKLAKGDIILFVDDDVNPLESLVFGHAQAHQKKEIVAVTGPVLTIEQAESNKNLSHLSGHEPLFLNGCNVSFKKWIFEVIGGFDENFTGVALGEDADMSHRILVSGGKIYFEPKAALIHLAEKHGGCRSEKNSARLAGDYIENSFYYWCKLGLSKKNKWRELLKTFYGLYRNRTLINTIFFPQFVYYFFKGAIKGHNKFYKLKKYGKVPFGIENILSKHIKEENLLEKIN